MPQANEVPVKQVESNQYSLNARDLIRGAIIAVIGAVLTSVQEAITKGGLDAINWRTVLTVAISALVSYLTLNFFNATKTITLYKKQTDSNVPPSL